MPPGEVDEKWLKGNRNVSIMEILPRLGTNVGRTTRGFLLGHMNKLGIKIITGANITKFDGRTIQYDLDKDTIVIENVDSVILATGVKPNIELHDKVKASNPSFAIFKIGDCKKPRTMLEAIHEGFKAAFKLNA
jgi:2,4-dienoyl-CoA reductase (NADPH2)